MSAFITTPERRANLVKLARFLWKLPAEKFAMEFFSSRGGKKMNVSDCAIGCAVGWGPTAGVQRICEDSSWERYADRVFLGKGSASCDGWFWCFSSTWAETDNTPQGAAKRILWMLLFGIPDDHYSPGVYQDWEPTEADWLAAEQGVVA